MDWPLLGILGYEKVKDTRFSWQKIKAQKIIFNWRENLKRKIFQSRSELRVFFILKSNKTHKSCESWLLFVFWHFLKFIMQYLEKRCSQHEVSATYFVPLIQISDFWHYRFFWIHPPYEFSSQDSNSSIFTPWIYCFQIITTVYGCSFFKRAFSEKNVKHEKLKNKSWRLQKWGGGFSSDQ